MSRNYPTTARSLAIAFAIAALIGSVCAQPCDSSLGLSFTTEPLGGYVVRFTPDIDTNGFQITSLEWLFSGGQAEIQDPLAIVQFDGEGYELACMLVGAYSGGVPCHGAHCELIEVPPDTTGCGGLGADFTIEIAGNTISFISTSTSLTPIDGWWWDFGDGSSDTGASPVHTYAAFGAYQVCLTTTTGSCSSTVCKWLYSGPLDIPCDTLLSAAFGNIVLNNTVAVFDESINTGMNVSVHWDFGDGAIDSGLTAVHTYAYEGAYQICATMTLTGPLAQVPCVTTVCGEVYTQAMVGVDELPFKTLPQPFPDPFSDRLVVPNAGLMHVRRWELVDATGRVAMMNDAPSEKDLVIETGSLPAGMFLLRLYTAASSRGLRVVKQ